MLTLQQTDQFFPSPMEIKCSVIITKKKKKDLFAETVIKMNWYSTVYEN